MSFQQRIEEWTYKELGKESMRIGLDHLLLKSELDDIWNNNMEKCANCPRNIEEHTKEEIRSCIVLSLMHLQLFKKGDQGKGHFMMKHYDKVAK